MHMKTQSSLLTASHSPATTTRSNRGFELLQIEYQGIRRHPMPALLSGISKSRVSKLCKEIAERVNAFRSGSRPSNLYRYQISAMLCI